MLFLRAAPRKFVKLMAEEYGVERRWWWHLMPTSWWRRRIARAVRALRGAAVLALLALSPGCALHVTMTHQLRAPIRCSLDRSSGKLGFVCEHPAAALIINPHPREGIPNL